MMLKLKIFFPILALLTLVSCQVESPAQRDPLSGSAWQLVSASGFTLLPGVSQTAEFLDGSLSGSAGCNRFSGAYQAGQGEFQAGPLAVTEMACLSPQGVMEQEQLYLAALSQAAAYQLDGGRLLLTGPQGAALTFAPLP